MLLSQLFETKDEIEKLKSLIRKDCSSFLKEAREPIFRGMSYDSSMVRKLQPGFYLGAVRRNRRPTSSGEEFTEIMDKFFTSQVGLPLRTNSLFCSTDEQVAYRYVDEDEDDSPAMIFPIGEFHYAWSAEIEDAYSTFGYFIEDPQGGGKEFGYFDGRLKDALIQASKLAIGKPPEKSEEAFEATKVFFEKFAHKFYHFDNGLNQTNGSELMIVCDKFYAVDYTKLDLDPEELLKSLRSQ